MAWTRRFLPFAVLLLVLGGIWGDAAMALPSFARQTGEACTSCHVQTFGAELTPRGREFKLAGYTEGTASSLPPISAMARGSTVVAEPFPRSSDGVFQASIFYAGRVAGPLGAYVEGSYQTIDRVSERVYLNKFDVRLADRASLGGHELTYGLSLNNEPGVQDLWNTLSVWTAQPASTIALLDRRLGGTSGGGSLYAVLDHLVYIEAGGYATLNQDVQRGIGRDNRGWNRIDGAAPYWRFVLQHQWDGHYLAVGHYGLNADLQRDTTLYPSAPVTHYSDLAVDATYQYLANPDHIVEVHGLYLEERANGSGLTTLGTSGSFFVPDMVVAPGKLHTQTVRLDATYTWAQTLGLSLGYQYVRVNALAPRGRYLSVYPTQTGHQEYLFGQLNYTPFGKADSLAAPWLNLRLNFTVMGNINQNISPTAMFNGTIAF